MKNDCNKCNYYYSCPRMRGLDKCFGKETIIKPQIQKDSKSSLIHYDKYNKNNISQSK